MKKLENIYGVSIASRIVSEKLSSVKTDLNKNSVTIERIYKEKGGDFAPVKKHTELITENLKYRLEFHLAPEDIKRIKTNLGWL